MEQPRRHLKMTIEVEADNMTELAYALDSFATQLLIDYAEDRKPENTRGFSAGYTASHSYELDVDDSMDGDRYREAVQDWIEHKKLLKTELKEAHYMVLEELAGHDHLNVDPGSMLISKLEPLLTLHYVKRIIGSDLYRITDLGRHMLEQYKAEEPQ